MPKVSMRDVQHAIEDLPAAEAVKDFALAAVVGLWSLARGPTEWTARNFAEKALRMTSGRTLRATEWVVWSDQRGEVRVLEGYIVQVREGESWKTVASAGSDIKAFGLAEKEVLRRTSLE